MTTPSYRRARHRVLLLHAHLVFVTWAATILGPPLGGAAIAVLGPACTVLTNAVSFLVSAVGIGAIGGTEARPPRAGGHRARDLLEGWRIIAATHPGDRCSSTPWRSTA
ncbi:hypothetical protein C1Y40_01102 [Mycobacterium talmoniae]|uniref:Uncharacterized protein n=1 Tax=Mycobacterium talmoniae TaxID=1858794 RepID=A0A2S8BQ38_9MYCO|nr:hypothetical protein C1Y40_01102 [Mycobacterium talmoniae]